MQTGRAFHAFVLAFVLIMLPAICLAQEQQLTPEQQREFLLKAKVIKSKQSDVGVTRPYTLTLSDGTITHDGSFQAIHERRSYKNLDRGGEMNFVDSYLYNLAAYELAKLLGLDAMMPVTVERKWEGKTGSLTWWLPVQMSLGKMQEKKIKPPDVTAWNDSMHKIWVFSQLVYDTDRDNPGNILIGKDWELYMIDFTRAFRLYHNISKPERLVRCSRDLLEKLRSLDPDELAAKTGKYLTKPEREGIMKRRDKIVAQFEKLVSEKGENAVLY
jgi:hypothetical protein